MSKKVCIAFSLFMFAVLRISAQSNLEFIENKGQWDNSVKYRADIPTGAFFLQKNGFTVLLQNADDLKKLRENHGHARRQKTADSTVTNSIAKNGLTGAADVSLIVRSHAYHVNFQDASENVEIIADKPLQSYNNYFIGNDPKKWATNCKIYLGVTYKNIYPNIDARYYTDRGVLKYDLIIHPGGNPDKIIMKYEGVDKINIRNNQLQIKTSVSMAKESTPSSYQFNGKGRQEVECNYFLAADNTIRFKIKNYAPDATLVIDPTLIFSTFTGSRADNWGFTATYGPDGSAYAGGIVHDLGFPTSTGAYQIDNKGGLWDVGLMKLSSDGSKRIYATYLGGNHNEYPHSLVVDPQGNLVVFGRTNSDLNSFPATLIGPCGGRDIFVTKFNATGTAIIGSLRIGGKGDDGVNIEDQDEINQGASLGISSLIRNYGDWSRGEVILDGSNNIYVASCSQSAADFPITPGVFQPAFGGGVVPQDAVILKINPSCSNLIFSSFLGGSNDDVAYTLDINPITGDLYVGGSTASTNMARTGGKVQPSTAGNIDGFISVISPDGTTLRYTTYLGTAGIDMLYGIKFDKFGFPYVMGTTTGTWPIVSGPAGASLYRNIGSKQFITKLKPDLSAIIYSTTFGSANASKPNISPVAFLVDRCQNVYVSGWGAFYTNTEPYDLAGTNGMPVTPDAIKQSTDNHDFYFIVLKRDAAGLLYGSFFGQTDNFNPSNGNDISEHVDGGTSRYDKNGVIYEAICANCYEGGRIAFPTTSGVWAPLNGTGADGCNLAVVKIAFNFAGVGATPQALINGVPDSVGCVPLTVTVQDLVRNAKSYIWNFGDGTGDTATTAYQVVHTYNAIGNYLVSLIAIDSTTCNIRDTVYVHITARNDKAILGFTPVKLPPCTSLSYQFNNFSTPPAGKPFTDSSFIWDFGDGTIIPSGPASITHFYAAPGTYNVRLMLVDTNYCNFPDSAVQTLSVQALVKAQFDTPPSGCAPYNALFSNTSEGGQQFFWDFGDGATSTDPSPTHLYPDTGTYTIRLTVIDSNTCNIIDSTRTTIIVSPKPHAAFTTTPLPPLVNTPTVFSNGSTGGVLFKWFFGDGDSAIRTTMDTVVHQYISNGPFNACLVVINQYQCTDTACASVQALINPLLDVPNAFTPGRFGENSIVNVKGFGISKLVFRIYNRWGQKVFESNNQYRGWDGTYNGKPQPMDVYAYIVEAVFSDGTRASKKGDITLIR